MSTLLQRPPSQAVGPVVRPGPATARLEYRLALDMAFSAVMARSAPATPDAPVVVLASTRAIAYESALRARPVDIVLCDPTWTLDVPDPAVLRPVDELASVSTGVAGTIWFSPNQEGWQTQLTQIERIVAPGGVVATLTAGSGNIFAPLRRDWGDGEPDWDGRELHDALRESGYRSRGRLELAGAETVFWVLMQRACALAGRPDLADRCEVAYRLSIAGRLRRVLPQFVLTLAERGGAP